MKQVLSGYQPLILSPVFVETALVDGKNSISYTFDIKVLAAIRTFYDILTITSLYSPYGKYLNA